MPSLEWNKRSWDGKYDWKGLGGNNWSAGYGNPESQWYASLYPRVHNFLPATTILEIAPGAGRWSQFLVPQCDRFIAVDYSQECVNICKARFAGTPHATFHANNGKSLAMLSDHSIDFVFCFDSLVHAEADVLESYVHELARKLKPQGVGFIHHSNLNGYAWIPATDSLSVKPLLWRLRDSAVNNGLWVNMHERGRSMSAKLFEQYCRAAGLQCIGQELINWGNTGIGGIFLIDCLSLFTPVASKFARPNRVIKNPHFIYEGRSILEQSKLYSLESFQ